jgi:hypothetical protein
MQTEAFLLFVLAILTHLGAPAAPCPRFDRSRALSPRAGWSHRCRPPQHGADLRLTVGAAALLTLQRIPAPGPRAFPALPSIPQSVKAGLERRGPPFVVPDSFPIPARLPAPAGARCDADPSLCRAGRGGGQLWSLRCCRSSRSRRSTRRRPRGTSSRRTTAAVADSGAAASA